MPRANKKIKSQGVNFVYPGGLTVSRTIGDIQAKIPRFGGNPNVIIPVPHIKSFNIHKSIDFIIMGSEGIFSKMANEKVLKVAWESSRKRILERDQ